MAELPDQPQFDGSYSLPIRARGKFEFHSLSSSLTRSDRRRRVPWSAFAVTAMLDRLLHHGHPLKCGPRSWRTKKTTGLQKEHAER
jgi:hypothetical protein